jgi:hypothetical protein
MKSFEKLIKKYFILLIVLLPLRKIAVAITITFGQKILLDHFGTFEEYEQGYHAFLDRIELFNIYLINSIIAIIIAIDLKGNRKLIGILLLTFINPVFGVTLFFIQQYYIINNLNVNHEQTH